MITELEMDEREPLRAKESHIKVNKLLFNIFQELTEYTKALLEGVAQVHFPNIMG